MKPLGHASWVEGKGWVRTPLPENVSRTLAKSAELDAALAVPIKGVTRPMSNKLAEMAARAKALRERHTKIADDVGARMATVETRGNAALDALTREVEKHEADVAQLESEVRQMSNES